MRRVLGAGLAVLLATQTLRADPAVPQLDAAHLQREDAQRIDQQQRRVAADAAPDEALIAPPPEPSERSGRITGFVLLGVGATAGVLSAALFAADSLDDSQQHPSRNTIAALLGVSAATAVVAGVAFLVTGSHRARRSQHAVQVAPSASPRAIGLTATGNF
ncbi:MAG TPA: hypothetical protein VGC42_20450 [Kofleriaceae bacterium]